MSRSYSHYRIFFFLLLLSLFLPAYAAPNWQSVEQLIKQQKYSVASQQTDIILKQAMARKDHSNWTRALVAGADYRIVQQQIETAVHFLQQQQWPKDKHSQLILSLYYANALSQYIDYYSWEINQREYIKTSAKTPLKKMTMEQLVIKVNNAYLRAWDYQSAWQTADNAQLKRYFKGGTYPQRIRGSLRDTIAYLWVDFLGNKSRWSATHSNEIDSLNLSALLSRSQKKLNLSAYKTHPLKRITWLLADLENWHLAQHRPEAAFEAARIRIQRLHQNFTDKEDRQRLLQALSSRIQQVAGLPWSNMGRWTLALFLQQSDAPDALIKSKAVLDKCTTTHTDSEGSQQCQLILSKLLKPYLNLTAMTSDGIQKRSIVVDHKNLKTLYFRAWKINMLDYLKKPANQRSLFIESLVEEKKADINWSKNLPVSRDYYSHKTYITPPMKQLGYWIIVASNTETFSSKRSNSHAIGLNLTKLVAETNEHNGQLEVTVFQGENGQASPRTTIELWQKNYPHLEKKIATVVTQNDGRAKFSVKKQTQYSLLLKQGDDQALVDNIYSYQYHKKDHSKSALLFTDRSIYRPGQKLQWKVVAYQGQQSTGNYRTLPKATGWVKLLDTNGKVVAKKQVKTNAYGSASGEFTLEQGRMLGRWRITTSWKSNTSIRVEEYKRPTFSAKIDDSKTALRLNKQVKLTGTARYYFGQAVTDGKVKWRVTRKPRFNWRWYRYRSQPRASKQIIASGTSKLNAKGQFKLDFLPQGDEKLQADHVEYAFEVSADITNSGGETRSVNRSYRLGLLSVKTDILIKNGFINEEESYKVNFSRTDLNGVGRAGSAYWTITRLQQPKQPQLPTDLPQSIAESKKIYATAGDKLKTRWTNDESIEARLNRWKDGQQIRKGSLRHDKTGQASLDIKGLPAGAYRLHYTTVDQWKQRFSTQQEFIIASNQYTPIKLPSFLQSKNNSVEVGDNVELLLGSGFKDLPVTLEVYHGDKLLKRSMLRGGIKQMAFPVTKAYRGGLDFILTTVKDYQILTQSEHISVPWTDRQLEISFSRFRDKLSPGQKETWRLTVKDSKGKPLVTGAAEILASMYDRSLDFFATLSPPNPLSLYGEAQINKNVQSTQQQSTAIWNYWHPKKSNNSSVKVFKATHLAGYENSSNFRNYFTGNSSRVRSMGRVVPMMAPRAPVDVFALQKKLKSNGHYTGEIDGIVGSETKDALQQFMQNKKEDDTTNNPGRKAVNASPKIRTNFNETAFFYPHLTLEKDGSVSFEFEAPESLTEWKVWVSAIGRDLRSGMVSKQVRTAKELMVRPYLPRFLREGDRAEIKVVVNNSGDKALSGVLELEIFDPDTDENLAIAFKLQNSKRNFQVAAGQSTSLRFSLNTPNKAGMIAIRTKASTGKLSDGEQRPLPILPSRIHLTQSRFVTLKDKDSKTLTFKQLATNNDPSRINDKLVITVEGQLFYSALNALPYLAEYPYECTEQTLNRYLSTSIVKSVFDQHPAVASMARKLSKRKSQYEKWDDKDANRKMLLEETPWLTQAEGGDKGLETLFRILDPKIASAQRKDALQKLSKAQTDSGGFPWWVGGRASPYMTMYLLHGFSRSLEFKSAVPKDIVQKAWRYLHKEFKDNLGNKDQLNSITFINYLLSAYPDTSWTGGVFNAKQRQLMLRKSFKQWTKLSPLLKSYLALTLHRAGRKQDAKLVFDSVMDGAKTDPQLGTYWAAEDRSWLWYNDKVDTHAFILRALTELNPNDPRRQGIVQWLMLDKKLNHWKSTRATAESIYALVHYLKHEKQLGIEERANVKIGSSVNKDWVFKADEYTGHKNQLVVTGDNIKPDMAKITVAKDTKGLMFASATWHFSTEKLPKQAQGDFFHITRKFYKRVPQGDKWTLQPLAEGASIAVGDQLEVQLSLRSKHNAEYIHLRSPRAAGYEPVNHTSGYRWEMGIGYYEEIRDSGANYFFEHLPAGEYSFKYRLIATTAGLFRTAPAMVQSVYAPEFSAYSSGKKLQVK